MNTKTYLLLVVAIAFVVLQKVSAQTPANYSSQFGNSIKMNGTNDAINIPNNAAINFGTGNFSVAFWYNSVNNNRGEIIFEKRDDVCGDGQNWAVRKSSDVVYFEINVPGPSSDIVAVANAADGKWHHIVFTRTATEISGFKDGILIATTAAAPQNVSNTAILQIGTGPCSPFFPGGNGFFTGRLDEVQLWNTALTQTQIVTNMNSQLSGNEAGLVLYYDMNRNGQGSGLTVDNKATVTGTALNGTTIGTANTPIFALGVTQQKPGSGNAVSFDGVDDKILIPQNSALNFGLNDNFSVECWAKIPIAAQPNASSETINILVEKHGGALGYPFAIRYRNTNSANSTSSIYKIEATRWNGTNQSMVTSLSALNDEKFHHIAFTKNGTNLMLYIDGLLNSTSADLSSGSTQNNEVLSIGMRTTQNNYPFKGEIDEVRIWNTALTQTQIRDRMCRKITSSDALYPNLVAYYNYDEGTGNIVLDATANNNDGILTNSPTRVTSGAAIGNASANDYVNATKTASLAHPSGESFTVTSTSGNPDGIHIYRVDEQPNTLTGTQGVAGNNKYFGVFQVGGTAPQYTAVYNYNGNPGVNAGNESTLALYKRNDNAVTNWVNGTATLNTTAKTLTLTGQSTEYILGSTGVALPLQLLSFKASLQNNNAVLQWVTSFEINTAYFEIQRSSDGISFVAVGSVPAVGNSANIQYYQFTDASLLEGIYQYRLKQVDVDGKFTYSSVIKLQFGANNNILIHPNPASSVIQLLTGSRAAVITVKIFDAQGKQVLFVNTGNQQPLNLNISSLAKGVYTVQWSDGVIVQIARFVKQ